MKPRISVIIPAGGSGTRFRREAPRRLSDKLFAPIAETPLIVHTLNIFGGQPGIEEIIIAVPGRMKRRFQTDALSLVRFKTPVVLVLGGQTRAESVLNALKRVSKRSDLICVHDAARPFARAEWLRAMMGQINGFDGIVSGRSAVPTVKTYDPFSGEIEETLNRSRLFEAETPQLFRKEVLLRAYDFLGKRAFRATDDASLVEAIGGRVKAFTHTDLNLKVTTYQDLILAQKVMEKSPALRFGIGTDRHRLVSGRAFYLGGIKIPAKVGPLGHSDGDPLLHAITDGILGALGAGDIGDLFSDRDARWKNKKSDYFLRQVLEMAKSKGYLPNQVDATVTLEKPKLGRMKEKIRAHLAKLLALPLNQVNVKAKTAEGLDAEGKGLAVSAEALVVLEKIW